MQPSWSFRYIFHSSTVLLSLTLFLPTTVAAVTLICPVITLTLYDISPRQNRPQRLSYVSFLKLSYLTLPTFLNLRRVSLKFPSDIAPIVCTYADNSPRKNRRGTVLGQRVAQDFHRHAGLYEPRASARRSVWIIGECIGIMSPERVRGDPYGSSVSVSESYIPTDCFRVIRRHGS